LADFLQGHNPAFVGAFDAAINGSEGRFILFLKNVDSVVVEV
jgi:hypothetical protein